MRTQIHACPMSLIRVTVGPSVPPERHCQQQPQPNTTTKLTHPIVTQPQRHLVHQPEQTLSPTIASPHQHPTSTTSFKNPPFLACLLLTPPSSFPSWVVAIPSPSSSPNAISPPLPPPRGPALPLPPSRTTSSSQASSPRRWICRKASSPSRRSGTTSSSSPLLLERSVPLFVLFSPFAIFPKMMPYIKQNATRNIYFTGAKYIWLLSRRQSNTLIVLSRLCKLIFKKCVCVCVDTLHINIGRKSCPRVCRGVAFLVCGEDWIG